LPKSSPDSQVDLKKERKEVKDGEKKSRQVTQIAEGPRNAT